jgi:hypothetical protein
MKKTTDVLMPVYLGITLKQAENSFNDALKEFEKTNYFHAMSAFILGWLFRQQANHFVKTETSEMFKFDNESFAILDKLRNITSDQVIVNGEENCTKSINDPLKDDSRIDVLIKCRSVSAEFWNHMYECSHCTFLTFDAILRFEIDRGNVTL